LDASADQLEERVGCSLVAFIADLSQLVVDAIHAVGNPVVANVHFVRGPVGVQHAEVVVEAMILLQHKNHMVDGLHTSTRNYGHRRRRRCIPAGTGRGRYIGCS